MVLGFLTRLIPGGIGGLVQGGGFGLGYGFMVRAGYDLYGAMRERILGQLQGLRYTPGSGTSMLGTGGLMGLQRTNDQSQPQQISNKLPTGVTKREFDRLAINLGNQQAAFDYLQNNRGHKPGTGPRSGHVSGRSDWYNKNVYQYKKERRQKYYNHKSFYDTFGIEP